MKLFVEFILLLSLLIWAYFTEDNGFQQTLYGASIGVGIAIATQVIYGLYVKRGWWVVYKDAFMPLQRREIRVSIAYLFKIEVNGRYLLVRNHRFANKFQPVGGVYKYMNSQGKRELEDLTLITDSSIENDEDNEHDLRLKMKSRRYLPKFLSWFLNGRNREVDPWREFYEELVKPGILPHCAFEYIQYELIGRHIQGLTYSEYFNIEEFKLADVFCLKFVNTAQEAELRNLAKTKQPHPDVLWVTEEEIRKGQSSEGCIIAEHTHKIFHTKILS